MPRKVLNWEVYRLVSDETKENGRRAEVIDASSMADAEALKKQKEVETGDEWMIYEGENWVKLPEENGEQKKFYLLTYKACNGGDCEEKHYSLHSSIDEAKAYQQKHLNPEHLKEEDAVNKWEPVTYGSPEILEFRTGQWGFLVWTIQEFTLI